MKGVSEISGLQSIKSMRTTGKRSIPRTQSSAYLDLYMMKKEKDRLEKEIYILDKRKKSIQKRLDDINREMEKLERQEAERKENFSQEFKKPAEKGWKRISLSY